MDGPSRRNERRTFGDVVRMTGNNGQMGPMSFVNAGFRYDIIAEDTKKKE